MSTENEGAGTTPPASDAAATDDYALPKPESHTAPAADRTGEGDAAGGAGDPADSPSETPSPVTLTKTDGGTPSGEPATLDATGADTADGTPQDAPDTSRPAAATPTTPAGAVPPPPTTPPSAPPASTTPTTPASAAPSATPAGSADAASGQPAPDTPPSTPTTPSGPTDHSNPTAGDPHGPNPAGTPHHPGPTGDGDVPTVSWAVPPSPAPRRRTGGMLAALLAAVLVAGGVGGGLGYVAADREHSSTTVSLDDSGDIQRRPDSVAGIARKALPSVVTIQAEGSTSSGTGTGFVFDKEGHILTNNHVVADAAEGGRLSVVFSNGKRYDAEVVGRAQGYDIAVLRLTNADGVKLKPLPLGRSDKVAVGDSTIAIGAPYGLSGTVTTGIISAKNRPVAAGGDSQGASASYLNALQTDASINPGNSGGPLLDAKGAVIGVNSAIKPAEDALGQSRGGSIGLGFAIPINQAKRVAQTLIKTGVPVYAVIGVRVELTESGNGARIVGDDTAGAPAVTPGGPADRAGLKPGDVITKIDDKMIDSGPTLIGTIWTYEPGDKVKVTYERNGKERMVEVTLDKREGD